MDLSAVVRPTPGHLASDLGDEVVLMSMKSGSYFGLRDVGLVVWKRLSKEPCRVESLIDGIVSEYAVSRDRAETDLLRLLSKLQENDLIEVIP